MRVTPTGRMEVCRWANHGSDAYIQDTQPLTFFQQGMAPFRQKLLAGKATTECSECHAMEAHGKVSGRQRQMIKVGMWPEDVDNSIRSTPFWSEFQHSYHNQGHTDCLPQDWQIELSNHCNSACLFCRPEYSSRLATEHRKLGLIDSVPRSWADDPVLVQRFVDTLVSVPQLRYLHFHGGETLIMPALATILRALLDHGHEKTHLGFTTNLTVWPQHLIQLLERFHNVHVNVSIESLGPLNDYVRWPSNITDVLATLHRWRDLVRSHDWWMIIRVTPTILTVHDLTTMYQFAWDQALPMEACNFLDRPDFMRPTVLPWDIRHSIADELETWITQHQTESQDTVYNTRHWNFLAQHLTEDASSYCRYLRDQPDESHRLSDLAQYLRKIDQHRGNSVLDYLPQYADILRSAGY